MYSGKYSLKNEIQRCRSCSVISRGCVNRIRLWPLRRDDNSGVLIGAGGKLRSDWPAHVLANDVSMRRTIDCTRAGTSGSELQHVNVLALYDLPSCCYYVF